MTAPETPYEHFDKLFKEAAAKNKEKTIEVMDDFYLNGVMTNEEYENKLKAIVEAKE